jgi:uncharacterized protein (DUF58 family)
VDRSRDSRAGAGSPLKRPPGWQQRLAGWLRPPRTLRPTRAGWSFFLITFGVGFAALNTGNNLLYLVLSLMLSFLVLSGVLSESALRGISVRRRLPRELFAEALCSVGLEITNRQQRVPSFAIVVEDRAAAVGAPERVVGRSFVLRAGPGRTEVRAYRFRPEQRGPVRFIGFRVSTRFPFGLFSKALILEHPERSLIYPALETLDAPAHFGAPRENGEGAGGARGDGSEAAGLREYRPGDSLRRIHWRSSLRRGDLVVRDVEPERESEVEVRLRTGGQRPGQPFERAVRWAASEVVTLLDAGSRVALRTDSTLIAAESGSGQRARLLSFLARVVPDLAADAGAP